jgi:hypothetical protein
VRRFALLSVGLMAVIVLAVAGLGWAPSMSA